MADASLYTFEHKELLELLVKAADVHDGKWVLQVNFGFTAGNIQTEAGAALPGTMVVVQKIGILRASEPLPTPNLLIDAAEVNPKR